MGPVRGARSREVAGAVVLGDAGGHGENFGGFRGGVSAIYPSCSRVRGGEVGRIPPTLRVAGQTWESPSRPIAPFSLPFKPFFFFSDDDV